MKDQEFEQKQQVEKIPLLIKLWFSVLSVIAILLLLYVIDICVFDYRYQHKIFIGSDCGYNIPAGYSIVYSKTEAKYCVCDSSWNGQYLYQQMERITPMFITIAKPSLFDTPCEAKAFLKEYIKESTEAKKPKIYF